MNIPNLINQTGRLPAGSGAYSWSLFMSLGFLLFGSAEVSLGISFAGMLLSCIALYKFASRFLIQTSNLALITILATLPSFVFLSRKDMKIDLGLLFISLVVINLVIEWIKKYKSSITDLKSLKNIQNNGQNFKIHNFIFNRENIFRLFVIGILLGLAFSIKYTSLILIIAVVGLFSIIFFDYIAVVISFAFSIFIILEFDLIKYQGIQFEYWQVLGGRILALVVVFILLTYLILRKYYRHMFPVVLKLMIIIFLGIILSYSPWLIKHIGESHSLKMHDMLYGRDNGKAKFDARQINASYKVKILENDQNNTEIPELKEKLPIEPSGTYELVTLYTGYEQGLLRFWTLPYDVIMSTNAHISLTHIFDIGILLLLILPLQVVILIKRKSQMMALVTLIFLIMFLFISFTSTVGTNQCIGLELNYSCILDSLLEYKSAAGFLSEFIVDIIIFSLPLIFLSYQTLSSINGIAIIALSSILFSLPCIYFLRYKEKNCMNYIFILLDIYMFLWILLGNGLFWYGLMGFVFLYLFLMIFQNIEWRDKLEKVFFELFKYIIYFWIFLAFINMFFVGVPNNIQIINPVFAKYMIGAESKEEALKELNPASYEALEILNFNSDAKIYKIGTLMEYFIGDNSSRVFDDRSLETFKFLYNSSQNKEQIASKMSLGGYKYLLLSFANKNLDSTSSRSLSKKYEALQEFVKDNPRLKPLKTDRLVLDKENGEMLVLYKEEQTKANFGFEGEIVREGGFFLYEILE